MTDGPDGPVAAGGTGPKRPALQEPDAWGMVSTLLAGPIVWGLIGAGVDRLVGTERVFLPIGVVIGFLTSFYITYVRYGRDAAE